MKTEAEKKANRKYETKIKKILLRFYPKESELYETARELGSSGIKELIKNTKK